MGTFELISLFANLLLGGGLIVTLITLKSTKEKAAAEATGAAADAESKEIDNAKKVVELWQQFAENKSAQDEKEKTALKTKIDELEQSVNLLKNEVGKLTRAINAAKKCQGAANCPALQKMDDNQ